MDIKICYIPRPRNLIAGTQRAVATKGSYWKVGETIEIYFMGGKDIERTRVLEVLDEVSTFVNLNFKIVEDQNLSDVRISFVKGAGSWSYLGSQATLIPKHMATLNIGWDDPDKSTTRHEIGHMLNLNHEHQNPEAKINWDRDAVIAALSGPPNNWTIQEIERNVLNPLSASNTDFTNFDPDSVMLYFFPASWTLDGKGTKANPTYSATDKSFLQETYPFPNTPPPPEENPILEFLRGLIERRKDLDKFRETQLVYIANELGIPATTDDFKRDTADKIWAEIF